jgi:hypothetical protein
MSGAYGRRSAELKRAVSVSLGSPDRDKSVVVDFDGQQIRLERIGTGGDAEQARRLFAQLDGQVDALSVGGIDLYVRLDQRDYPVRSALRLVQDVYRTPVVDGRLLKYVLERQVFRRAAPALGGLPRFENGFIPLGVDRMGLIEAVSSVSGRVVMGDLMFMLGVPIPIVGLDRFRRLVRLLMPLMGYLPMTVLYPPGSRDEATHPKHARHWLAADLIAGDMHYILKYAPPDLPGRVVVTNTTTQENLEMLRARGVRTVITTTPRYEGRSFGVNAMEAVLTAYAGLGRPLTPRELERAVEELDLRPEVLRLDG